MTQLNLFKNKREYQHIRLPRTVESTVWDGLTALLALVLWVVAIVLWLKVGSTVPTHFNAAGRADAYGDRSGLFLLAAFGTLCLALLAYSTYRPKYVNSPVKLLTMQQIMINARLLRVMTLLIGGLFLCIELKTGEAVTGFSDDAFGILMVLFLLSILFTVMVFQIILHLKRPK